LFKDQTDQCTYILWNVISSFFLKFHEKIIWTSEPFEYLSADIKTHFNVFEMSMMNLKKISLFKLFITLDNLYICF